jgi:hypothetical protein
MRDNLRRYRARRAAVTPGYPGEPQGQVAWHFTPLAALLSGLVGSKRTQLPQSATHVPDGNPPASRGKRLTRWVCHDKSTAGGYLVPYAAVLLAPFALQTLVLGMDGSVVGRGGIAWMLPVVSTGRALPLAWLVRPGKQGPFPEALQVAGVEQRQGLIPPGASVVLLGEGACDGTGWQQTGHEAAWHYVCRPGCHLTAGWHGATWRLATTGAWIKPGPIVDVPEGGVPGEA